MIAFDAFRHYVAKSSEEVKVVFEMSGEKKPMVNVELFHAERGVILPKPTL